VIPWVETARQTLLPPEIPLAELQEFLVAAMAFPRTALESALQAPTAEQGMMKREGNLVPPA